MQNVKDQAIGAIISNLIMANSIEPVTPSKVPFVMEELAKLDGNMLALALIESKLKYRDYLETKAFMDRCYYTTKDKIL